jgi:hypothetical protein
VARKRAISKGLWPRERCRPKVLVARLRMRVRARQLRVGRLGPRVRALQL